MKVPLNDAPVAAARDGSSAAPANQGTPAARGGEPVAARPRPGDVLQIAREMFLQGRRLDMGMLAAKVGVSRTTLYRWTGNRDRLLARILWSRHKEISAQLEAETHLKGKELIARRIESYMQMIATSRPLLQWIHQEPEVAFRVLIRRRSDFGTQERSIEDLARLIERERRRGTYRPRLNPDTLAYAIARIIEGFVYRDILAGMEPDLKGANEVIRALL
jgi:AcrR family transcriptional regulator